MNTKQNTPDLPAAGAIPVDWRGRPVARVRYLTTGGNVGISWRAVSEHDCADAMPLEGDSLYDDHAVSVAVQHDRRRVVDALRVIARHARDQGRAEVADAYFTAADVVNDQA